MTTIGTHSQNVLEYGLSGDERALLFVFFIVVASVLLAFIEKWWKIVRVGSDKKTRVLAANVSPAMTHKPPQPATSPDHPTDAPARSPSTSEPTEQAKEAKRQFLSECIKGCNSTLDGERRICREQHDFGPDDLPIENPEYMECLNKAIERNKTCCERCRQEAFRRFGFG